MTFACPLLEAAMGGVDVGLRRCFTTLHNDNPACADTRHEANGECAGQGPHHLADNNGGSPRG